MRSWVSSLMYSQVLSSKVSRAVGEPGIAETSALVEVPGVNSFIDSGSTLLPRSCGGGINHEQEDSNRQAIPVRRQTIGGMATTFPADFCCPPVGSTAGAGYDACHRR